jgi:hypothetical protein
MKRGNIAAQALLAASASNRNCSDAPEEKNAASAFGRASRST